MEGGNFNNTSSVSQDVYDKPSLVDSLGLVGGLVSFYVLVEVCAVVSNVTILIAIVRRLVPRNTVNMFFSSLAVSDIILVVLSLLDCCAYLNGGWEFGEVTCKIQSLFLEVCFSASTLTLVAVSCERYLLICQPHMKRRRSRLIYYSTYSIVVYLLPLFLMAFTHWRISETVRANNQRQKTYTRSSHMYTDAQGNNRLPSKEEGEEMVEDEDSVQHKCHKVLCGPMLQLKKKVSSSADKENKRQERRMKVVRMLFVVTVTFAVLWTPFIILRVASLAGVEINEYIYKFAEILILSSTAVNGFIYAYMSPPFRKAFKAILFCQNKGDLMRGCTQATMSNSEDHRRFKTSNESPSESQGSTSFSKKKPDVTPKGC